MKRLFIVASLAIMAVGCQKTEVQNEVLTPIGFNAETGKATRVVNTGATFENSNFAVYSYGNGTEAVMQNVTVEESTTANVWEPTGNVVYYWPNDASTTLDFYAYSPALATMSHDLTDGFSVTYTQEVADPYVDFMVATPIKGATYNDQDGTEIVGNGTIVPMAFNHKLTQVVFNVKSNIAGVTAVINSIKLNNVGTTAEYTENATEQWATPTATGVYTILDRVNADDAKKVLPESATEELENTVVCTKPVTLIPQDLTNVTFDINYTLSGDNIANETVNKTGINITDATIGEWEINKRVVYTLNISLETIKFTTSVNSWDTPDVTGSIDIKK